MSQNLYLNQLNVGEKARITELFSQHLPSKLYDFGIAIGVVVTVFSKVPFQGPICLLVGLAANKIVIRADVAKHILVERL